MNQQLLLSLDYELFFGQTTGTVDRCLIQPTKEIARLVRRYGVYLSLFVDTFFLRRLAEEAARHPRLLADLDAIRKQLIDLKTEGHDIQLHLHPHWLDSFFDGEQWRLDTRRYKLHDFTAEELPILFGSATSLLRELVGDTVFAFRAGGWCLQPFAHIAHALHQHGIWLDSTVFPGGLSDDKDRWFDFVHAPQNDYWLFDTDPNQADSQGSFVEIPISAFRVSPLLYWRMAFLRKVLPATQHRSLGDGSALSWGNSYYLKKLTQSTISVASVDGVKASFLSQAFQAGRKHGKQLFHVMGHPKALSKYSLAQLDTFLQNARPYIGVTFQDFIHLMPIGCRQRSP